MIPMASDIIRVCEEEFPAWEHDCSGYVKAVASRLGVKLTGMANDIVDQIQGPDWIVPNNYGHVKQFAGMGRLVIAGLKGSDQAIPNPHGHVVVIVDPPTRGGMWQSGDYPVGCWGALHGQGCMFYSINWAWNRRLGDLAKVKFGVWKKSLELTMPATTVPEIAGKPIVSA